MAMSHHLVTVRYMVDDVERAVDFYTEQFRFERGLTAAPAFAEVTRDVGLDQRRGQIVSGSYPWSHRNIAPRSPTNDALCRRVPLRLQ
jgi:catechol 2,3-dioxygenase-like lactoylglutathione lyase family enzyme